VVPWDYSEEKGNDLMMELIVKLQELDWRYQCVITMEQSYIAKQG